MDQVQAEYLTVAQFATAIRKGRRTVQRWLDDGTLKSDMKLPGATGAHLFRAERVGEFLATENEPEAAR